MKGLGVIATILLFLGCSGDSKREGLTDGGTYYVYWDAIPNEIPFNEPFQLSVMVHDGDDRTQMYMDRELYVNATMPTHGHGMETTTEVTQTGGLYIVEGMLFHMAGEWELTFAVSDGETVENASFQVNCCEL